MAAILQMTNSDAFSSIKMLDMRFKYFTEICSHKSSWQYTSIGLDNG